MLNFLFLIAIGQLFFSQEIMPAQKVPQNQDQFLLQGNLETLRLSMKGLKDKLGIFSGKLGELKGKLGKKKRDGAKKLVLITLVQGNITGKFFKEGRANNAAIVNAANEVMLGGGGIDGIIHDKAGPTLVEEEKLVSQVTIEVRCPTGEARLMMGHNLYPLRIINTVGPRGSNPEKAELLSRAYQKSLACADALNLAAGDVLQGMSPEDLKHKFGDVITKEKILEAKEVPITTIVFPCISTAIFGYDINEAVPVAVKAVFDYLDDHPESKIEEVRFITFREGLRQSPDQKVDYNDYGVYRDELKKEKYKLREVAIPADPHYLRASSLSWTTKPAVCYQFIRK